MKWSFVYVGLLLCFSCDTVITSQERACERGRAYALDHFVSDTDDYARDHFDCYMPEVENCREWEKCLKAEHPDWIFPLNYCQIHTPCFPARCEAVEFDCPDVYEPKDGLPDFDWSVFPSGECRWGEPIGVMVEMFEQNGKEYPFEKQSGWAFCVDKKCVPKEIVRASVCGQ